MATFAERFKELRKEKGLTQNDLAKVFFISKSAISKYENGVNIPENKLLQDMASFFEVSVDYLLGRIDMRLPSLFSGSGGLNISPSHNEYSYIDKIYGLNKNDEKDIEKNLVNTMEMLEGQEGLMLSGNPIDEEDWELLKAAIKNGLEYAKKMNKQKYTPKKYRK